MKVTLKQRIRRFFNKDTDEFIEDDSTKTLHPKVRIMYRGSPIYRNRAKYKETNLGGDDELK